LLAPTFGALFEEWGWVPLASFAALAVLWAKFEPSIKQCRHGLLF
jgi:hypothetical protein